MRRLSCGENLTAFTVPSVSARHRQSIHHCINAPQKSNAASAGGFLQGHSSTGHRVSGVFLDTPGQESETHSTTATIMATIRSYKINLPRITSQTIDDEVIIIDLQNGNYYSLTQAGAGVWSGIEDGRFSDEITAAVAAQYEGEPEAVKSAIEQFLNTLLEEELIVVNETREIDDFAATLPTAAPNGLPRCKNIRTCRTCCCSTPFTRWMKPAGRC
jgi:hypothetical protein